MQIQVYQGSVGSRRAQQVLGSLRATGIRRKRRGDSAVGVTFIYRHNGIVHVTAKDKGAGEHDQIQEGLGPVKKTLTA